MAHIVDGQKEDGGWFYAKGETFDRNKGNNSDTSVTGWQYQALKAAHNSGFDFPGVKETLTDSMKNFYRVYNAKNGGFGYQVKSHAGHGKHKLTGVGVIGLQGWRFGHGNNDRNAIIKKGCEHIWKNKHLKYDSANAILYSWYYETQAMFNKGAPYWDKWNEQLRPELLANQILDGTPANGSWREEGPGGKSPNLAGSSSRGGSPQDNEVYRTTLCLLMLEVYYRYVY